jgi:hypothetical protein
MDSVIVQRVSCLPGGVKGLTFTDEGDYIILIRDDLSKEDAMRVYLHELSHIQNYDFESPEEAGQIEARTHRST